MEIFYKNIYVENSIFLLFQAFLQFLIESVFEMYSNKYFSINK